MNVRINIIYNFVDYTRNIWIKDKVFISDYDIIYLTGMNISNYILELSKTLCAQCGKTCNSSDILTMKCQCQFCKECLTSNLQASTNGEMLLNKFEKKGARTLFPHCKLQFIGGNMKTLCGTDIIEISRIKESIERSRRKIFKYNLYSSRD